MPAHFSILVITGMYLCNLPTWVLERQTRCYLYVSVFTHLSALRTILRIHLNSQQLIDIWNHSVTRSTWTLKGWSTNVKNSLEFSNGKTYASYVNVFDQSSALRMILCIDLTSHSNIDLRNNSATLSTWSLKGWCTNVSSPLDFSKGTSMLSQALGMPNAITTIPNRCLDLGGQDCGYNECNKMKLQPDMRQDI